VLLDPGASAPRLYSAVRFADSAPSSTSRELTLTLVLLHLLVAQGVAWVNFCRFVPQHEVRHHRDQHQRDDDIDRGVDAAVRKHDSAWLLVAFFARVGISAGRVSNRE
jgi:hypothetical protein